MAIKKPKKTKSAKADDRATIGIIGGSGLYEMNGLTNTREIRVKTPFGDPSDAMVLGTLEGKRVAFLARHGCGHRILPSEINYRANIYAMKLLSVERIISVSAVGSLKEDLQPGEFLVPDQFFDRTKNRACTFFGDGIVAHVAFAHPTCGPLSGVLADACVHEAVKVHRRGTYICIEGPQFSTLAEALVNRELPFEVIGMTNLTEAKLAREAEICYATMALVTDYDCWHESAEPVSVEQILGYLKANAEMAQHILRLTVPRAAARKRDCACVNALQYAIVTDPAQIPRDTKEKLAPIIGKYIQ